MQGALTVSCYCLSSWKNRTGEEEGFRKRGRGGLAITRGGCCQRRGECEAHPSGSLNNADSQAASPKEGTGGNENSRHYSAGGMANEDPARCLHSA